MSLTTLKEAIDHITPADREAMAQARARWDRIAKPLGSLGLLEEAVVRAAGAMGTAEVSWSRKAVAVFCADSGAAEEAGIQDGPAATAAVASAMARGEACVCRMAWSAGAEVFPVDIGMASSVEEEGILHRHVLRGTRSITQGPAMTRGDAVSAMMTGVWMAEDLLGRGFDLLAAGEMGVGSTAAAAAAAGVLLELPPERTAGPAPGLSREGLLRRQELIARAVRVNKPNPEDPIDVLAKVGGLDIAAMTGFFLGAALHRVPVVLDGAVSCTAALAAVRLCPDAAKSMIASHRPAEPCGGILLDALGLKPFIDAGMYLGEGSGAVAAMPMLDMALSIYRGMAGFDRLGIRPYEK